MTSRYQIYKCEICGNIVEAVHGGTGQLVCCSEDMVLFTENTVDAAKEKHVPVVEAAGARKKSIILNGSRLSILMGKQRRNSLNPEKVRKLRSALRHKAAIL